MIDLIIAASGGAISIAIAWIVAIMRRRETVEARQEIATVRNLCDHLRRDRRALFTSGAPVSYKRLERRRRPAY